MTCIVSHPTKKALKEALLAGKTVFIEDPSIFAPRAFSATDMAIGQSETVTNHPKRSWFGRITRTADGFKVS
jgi:hypothetical protein